MAWCAYTDFHIPYRRRRRARRGPFQATLSVTIHDTEQLFSDFCFFVARHNLKVLFRAMPIPSFRVRKRIVKRQRREDLCQLTRQNIN